MNDPEKCFEIYRKAHGLIADDGLTIYHIIANRSITVDDLRMEYTIDRTKPSDDSIGGSSGTIHIYLDYLHTPTLTFRFLFDRSNGVTKPYDVEITAKDGYDVNEEYVKFLMELF